MATLLNISEAASIALHAMGHLAANDSRPIANREIAEALGVSGAHLSKVLQRLVRGGLVHSATGPGGGFTLAKPSRRITLLNIYEKIAGPYRPSACLLPKPVCNGNCMLGGQLTTVNKQVIDYLSKTRLSDLADKNGRTKKHAKTHRKN